MKSVINQMDTSHTHLGGDKPRKPEKPSNQELSAILKYGAQNMYASVKRLNYHADPFEPGSSRMIGS
jgi:hypothetical protein